MIHIGAQSDFSIGESILKIEPFVDQAHALGYTTLSLCDTMSISGLSPFSKTCVKYGIKPIIGARVRCVDDSLDRSSRRGTNTAFINLFVRNDDGLIDLMELLSIGFNKDHFYYVPRVSYSHVYDALAKGNLVATTGAVAGLASLPEPVFREKWAELNAAGFAFMEIAPIDTPYYDAVADLSAKVAAEGDHDLLLTHPVCYDRGKHDAFEVAKCITGRMVMTDGWRHIQQDKMLYLRERKAYITRLENTAGRCMRHYGGHLGTAEFNSAIANQDVFADLISFTWHPLPVSLPKMADNEIAELVKQCKAGWSARLTRPVLGYQPDASMMDVYKDRLRFELGIIQKMSFERYFLLVSDLVRWSKSEGIIVGPGRGSVGGSLVAYLIGITDVDPIRFGLLFERFINPDRIDLPDADLDFQSSKRDSIIKYLIKTYGDKKVAGISNYTTMGASAALRDVGRVFGLEQRQLHASKAVPKIYGASVPLKDAVIEVPDLMKFFEEHPKVVENAIHLEGTLRSLGKHAAGVVVSEVDLNTRAVVEFRNGSILNWDKRVVEDFGLVKIDILGLSNLDLIGMILDYIENTGAARIDPLDIPLDDEGTLRAFAKGHTLGVFQFESAGMRKLLRDIGWEGMVTFDDLVATTSLYRPGPKDSGLLDDYVAIRQGIRSEFYEHPSMELSLKETKGIMIYQEQVMQIVRDLAGFTLIESDHVRKALGKKDAAKLASYRKQFVEGAAKGRVKITHDDATEEVMHYTEAVRRGYVKEAL